MFGKNLENIEKITFGLGGVGELMQVIDYENINHSTLRRVGLLIESVSNEIDREIHKIKMDE